MLVIIFPARLTQVIDEGNPSKSSGYTSEILFPVVVNFNYNVNRVILIFFLTKCETYHSSLKDEAWRLYE